MNANDLWHNPCDSEPKNKKKNAELRLSGNKQNVNEWNGMEKKTIVVYRTDIIAL